jgi:hypothetical protein
MKEILLSGCKSNQISVARTFDELPGVSIGAFSFYGSRILSGNAGITYRQFHTELRKSLPQNSIQLYQEPQLEGTDENKDSVMFNGN